MPEAQLRAGGMMHGPELELVGVLGLVDLVRDPEAVLAVDRHEILQLGEVGPLEALRRGAAIGLRVEDPLLAVPRVDEGARLFRGRDD